MSALHSRFAWALAAWLLAPAASAQDGGTTSGQGSIAVNPISIGGEDINTLEEIVRLGIADCQANAILLLDLDGIPDKNSIDVYIGDGCNSTNRTRTDLNKCTLIDTDVTRDQTRDLQFELEASKLFVNGCDDGMEAERTIWFISVGASGSAEDVGNDYGTMRIELDGRAPDPPTDVEGGSGERQIEVNWDTDEADLEGFVIYIDPGSGGGSAGSGAPGDDDGGTPSDVDCGSGLLRPGGEAPDPDDFERAIELNEATATGETLSPNQIGGTRAAIAVAAVDLAGNRSELSELACVSVMATESFWDRYEANGGTGQAGCPCSALGPVHAHSAWPVALALLFIRRSARRRRSP
jgi:hypothetical protein